MLLLLLFLRMNLCWINIKASKKPDHVPSLAFFANEPLLARNLRAGFPSPYGLEDAKAFIAFCHQ